MLKAKWTTLSITFAFLDCPSCKKPMNIDKDLPIIGAEFQKWLDFKAQVEEMAKEEAYTAGLKSSARL